MGVSEKRQNFHFGVEYPFNYRSINQFVVFLQKIKEERAHSAGVRILRDGQSQGADRELPDRAAGSVPRPRGSS